MAIVVSVMTQQDDGFGDVIFSYPDYCILKEQFCPDPDDDTFVTIGLGGGTEITKAELKTRALDIHTRYPFNNVDMSKGNPPTITERTESEVETLMNEWCTEKNVA